MSDTERNNKTNNNNNDDCLRPLPDGTRPWKYGKYYWCVKTDISESGDIYLYADRVEVQHGALVFLREDGFFNLAIPPGQWTAVYAASCLDGHAVCVQHWKGEVDHSYD